ncbi:hypothetical protein [Microbulbifer sp. PAAF003]|uniref:hypothetical protein n=1 Tax=Microbulbifer sp. PAAF003 TaxID=3243375 RepID=UPI004039AF5D
MKEHQIQKVIDELPDDKKIQLLCNYGHQLTIHARGGYEFQGSGVTDPRLLRDCNEIQHRVFQAVREVAQDSDNQFCLNNVGGWISAEERNETIRTASVQAFQTALAKLNT